MDNKEKILLAQIEHSKTYVLIANTGIFTFMIASFTFPEFGRILVLFMFMNVIALFRTTYIYRKRYTQYIDLLREKGK